MSNPKPKKLIYNQIYRRNASVAYFRFIVQSDSRTNMSTPIKYGQSRPYLFLAIHHFLFTTFNLTQGFSFTFPSLSPFHHSSPAHAFSFTFPLLHLHRRSTSHTLFPRIIPSFPLHRFSTARTHFPSLFPHSFTSPPFHLNTFFSLTLPFLSSPCLIVT